MIFYLCYLLFCTW